MLTRVALALAALSALAVPVALHARGEAPARPPADRGYVRGVALGLFATDPEWDYAGMVEEIRARGATDVLVVVNGYQATRFASDVALRPGRSPSPATVRRTLLAVRRAGMRAALMPVVRISQRAPGDWRGRITPADGLDAWFAAYARFVMPLARAAADGGATRFVVGSELGSLEPYADRWRALIRDVRQVFPGSLTYSANWDRAAQVPFWDALDEIGTTAYFPLATDGPSLSPSTPALRRAWAEPRRALASLSRRLGRPLLVTEVGYTSQVGAHVHPWDHTTARPIDLDLQARLYASLCDTFLAMPTLEGFYVWNWFGFGGPRDGGYSPRGKPSAAALARCFARPVPFPVDPPAHHLAMTPGDHTP